MLQPQECNIVVGNGEILAPLQLVSCEGIGFTVLEVIAVTVQGVDAARLKILIEDLNINLKCYNLKILN